MRTRKMQIFFAFFGEEDAGMSAPETGRRRRRSHFRTFFVPRFAISPPA
jgi:hypothetical protein